jgi:hypothetical protein
MKYKTDANASILCTRGALHLLLTRGAIIRKDVVATCGGTAKLQSVRVWTKHFLLCLSTRQVHTGCKCSPLPYLCAHDFLAAAFPVEEDLVWLWLNHASVRAAHIVQLFLSNIIIPYGCYLGVVGVGKRMICCA